MMDDFLVVLEHLDDLIARNVVHDKGLALAIYRTIHRDGAMRVSELRQKLRDEWRFSNANARSIRKVVGSIGFKAQVLGPTNDLMVSAL